MSNLRGSLQFLQDEAHPSKPEFTVLVEPGEGYVGGKTFFSLVEGSGVDLIRPVDQQELDRMVATGGTEIPASLKTALCTFYLGAALKRITTKRRKEQRSYSMLCHISERTADHNAANVAIQQFKDLLLRFSMMVSLQMSQL